MTDITAPQGRLYVVSGNPPTANLRMPQGNVMAPFNVPTKNMRAAQAELAVSYRAAANPIRMTQATIMAVVDGRVATPQVRTYTYTLDGHDFYGIRLGDNTTLEYDVASGEWTERTSNGLPFMRINCATNWIGAPQLGFTYGSDVICGDDTWGLIYFMDPNLQWDQNPNDTAPEQELEFDRIVMAQTTVDGRQFVPCYAIFLDGDNYGITADSFTPYVQLETSDDQGVTWLNHGVITTQPNVLDTDYRWTSLGQMQSPGRLFRVTDNGILARIDSMEMNDD